MSGVQPSGLLLVGHLGCGPGWYIVAPLALGPVAKGVSDLRVTGVTEDGKILRRDAERSCDGVKDEGGPGHQPDEAETPEEQSGTVS